MDHWYRRGPGGGDHRAWLCSRVEVDGVGQGQRFLQENALGLAGSLGRTCRAGAKRVPVLPLSRLRELNSSMRGAVRDLDLMAVSTNNSCGRSSGGLASPRWSRWTESTTCAIQIGVGEYHMRGLDATDLSMCIDSPPTKFNYPRRLLCRRAYLCSHPTLPPSHRA